MLNLATPISEDQLSLVQRRLEGCSLLFGDAKAYLAGVEDTLAAVRRLLEGAAEGEGGRPEGQEFAGRMI